MAVINLGNTSVLEPFKQDEATDTFDVRPRPDLGQRVHQIGIPPSMQFEEAMGHIRRFIGASFGEPPAWVESDDPILETLIAREYDCPVGRPKNWVEGVVDEADDSNDSEQDDN